MGQSVLTASRLPPAVDREFDTVSSFLLRRTKDMVNKYRQLLVRDAQVRPRLRPRPLTSAIRPPATNVSTCRQQQESPSAEMVMLERLFLQAERCALVEDRRRARRDPGQCPRGRGTRGGRFARVKLSRNVSSRPLFQSR